MAQSFVDSGREPKRRVMWGMLLLAVGVGAAILAYGHRPELPRAPAMEGWVEVDSDAFLIFRDSGSYSVGIEKLYRPPAYLTGPYWALLALSLTGLLWGAVAILMPTRRLVGAFASLGVVTALAFALPYALQETAGSLQRLITVWIFALALLALIAGAWLNIARQPHRLVARQRSDTKADM